MENYSEKQFFIDSSGILIPSVYAYPIDGFPKRAIVLLHGISSNKNEYLNFYKTLAIELAKNKVATLRIDFRGHGESNLPPAGFTIASQLIDLHSAIDWILKETNLKKVDLIGSSFGCPPCISASSLFGEIIDNVYLIAPVLDYYKTFIAPSTTWGKKLFHDVIERTIAMGEKVYMDDTFYLHQDIVSEMCMVNIEANIAKSNKTIHVMHGNMDGMVPISISQEIASRNSNIVFYEFDNMEHGFTNLGDEKGDSEMTINNINKMLKIINNEQLLR